MKNIPALGTFLRVVRQITCLIDLNRPINTEWRAAMKKKTFLITILIIIAISLLLSGCKNRPSDSLGSETEPTSETHDVAPAIFYSNEDLITFVKTGSQDLDLYSKENPPTHIPYRPFEKGDFLNVEDILKGQTELLGQLQSISVDNKNRNCFYYFNNGITINTYDFKDNIPNYTLLTQHFNLSFEDAIATKLGCAGKEDDREKLNHCLARSVDGKKLLYNFHYLEEELMSMSISIYTERFSIQIVIPITDYEAGEERFISKDISPLLSDLFTDGEERDAAVRGLIKAVTERELIGVEPSATKHQSTESSGEDTA